MSISAVKATHGLTATFTAEAPNVSWSERIGGSAETVRITAGTHAYELSATLGNVNDYLALDLAEGTASVTGSGNAANNTLTLTGNAVADETVTIGSKTYTWKTSVSTTANQVKIGATASDSIDNLIAAINHGAGSGTVYGSATTAHPSGTASAGAGDTMLFTASAVGTAGNSIATTETMTNGSWGFATLSAGINASTLTGGDGKDSEGNDLPTQAYLNGIHIRCTAGIIHIVDGNVLNVTLSPGGALLIAEPAGFNSLIAEDLMITAASIDSAVSIEVISQIAD